MIKSFLCVSYKRFFESDVEAMLCKTALNVNQKITFLSSCDADFSDLLKKNYGMSFIAEDALLSGVLCLLNENKASSLIKA